MAESQKTKQDIFFELGELYCERTDFERSCENFEKAAKIFGSEGNLVRYVECLNFLLRMYVESENFTDLERIKENVRDLEKNSKAQLTAKTFYTLGRCASYEAKYDEAIQYLKRSLSLALKKDSKEDMCFAINGLAIVYSERGFYDKALKEIDNLRDILQVSPSPKIQFSSLLLNGRIQKALGKPQEALEIFWKCYALLKDQKNVSMQINLLYHMGSTYRDLKEDTMARLYFKLAKKMIDPKSLKSLDRAISEGLTSMGSDENAGYDLVFQKAARSVLEKRKGKIDFRNQFILLDLLRLFVSNPGRVYSKEHLAHQVWQQNYDPRVHDNKIYVTIKRLRQIIEPDLGKPKYIFRTKNGYYLNEGAKVLLE